jgi:hypothetical protein
MPRASTGFALFLISCMLPYMQQKTLFMYIGGVLSALQMGVFIFSTPPFQSGVWHITEPLMLAHYVIAFGIFNWLAYGYSRNWITLPARNAFTLILGTWIALQIITAIFSESPWRSWFGAPPHGEATAWWMALVAGILCNVALWHNKRAQALLIVVAAIATVTLTSLHVFLHDPMLRLGEPLNPWEPNSWPDYLAFFSAYLWLAYSASSKNTHPLWRIVIIAACLFALLNSHNFLGIVLLTAVLIPSVLSQVSARFNEWFVPSRTWRMLAIICLFLPMGWWGYSLHFQHESMGLAAEESIFAARNEGMGSRILLNNVAINTIQHDPTRLLGGNGFGHFTDDLLQYGLVDGVSVFDGTTRKPNWFLLDGTGYHSHSQPMEALLSFGMLGMLLFLAMPAALLWLLPNAVFFVCAPIIVAITMLSYFWFELPHSLGIHALAMAAVIAMLPPTSHTTRSNAPALLCLLAALAMLWTSWSQIHAIDYGKRLFADIRATDCSKLTPAFLAQDIERGAERFNEIAISYVVDLVARIRQQNILSGDAECVEKIFDTTHTISQDTRTSDYAAALWLQLHYELFLSLNHPAFDSLRAKAITSFSDAALAYTARAPYRDDKAAIFLINLGQYTNSDVNKQIDILQRMLQTAPNHRSAQWLMGYLLAQNPATQTDGTSMKQDALNRGVERVFPITNK